MYVLNVLFTGFLRLVLGLQHYGGHRGTNLQAIRSAYVFEWTKPSGLLQILRYLWLCRCLDGQRLRLRGQQWAAVDKHLPLHLCGEAPPAGSIRAVTYSVSNMKFTFFSNRIPNLATTTASLQLLTSKTTGSSPKEMSRHWLMQWRPSVQSQ